MTETEHGASGPGNQGPRVSPAQMRDIDRLRRSTSDRRVAGVAGGLGRHFDIDPTVIRVLLVVLVLFGGAGLLLYGTVWLFVPQDGSDAAPIGTSPATRTAVLLAALTVAALLLVSDGSWMGFGPHGPPLLPVLLVAVVAWLALRHRGDRGAGRAQGSPTDTSVGRPADTPTHPPARPPRPRSLFGITMATVLLVMGAVALLELAVTPLPWAVYPAAALTVIGFALLTGAFFGRATGLTFMGVLSTGVLAIAVWAPELAFGDLNAHPTSAAAVHDRYAYTAGRLRLDLTEVQDIDQLDGRTLDLSMRAGEVFVELPDGLDVDVHGTAQGGRLDVLGAVAEGRTITNDQSTARTTAPDLHINLDLGFGNAIVSTP